MINKICTDLNTSKKLKELGIEDEAFFYWWFCDFDGEYHLDSEDKYIHPRHLKNKIKAYTFEQILEMLPRIIIVKRQKRMLGVSKESVYYKDRLGYPVEPYICDRIFLKNAWNGNLATTAAKLLIKLDKDKIK